MLKHEAKLIDPDAEQVVAALALATAAANKRCRARLLRDTPAKWRKFARDAAATAEGYSMFRGSRGGVPATQLVAAWWTDPAGRKHVVLRGRRVEHDEAKRLLQKEELEKRPPLWHAYPEYVCRRTVGKASQIVCGCGCGAVGTPESLGWMGETCGPCFDRKEELGAVGLSANVPGMLDGDRAPLRAVACSPDGTRVAAKEGDDHVTYWDVATRTRTVMKFSGANVSDVAITADGRYLLVVGNGLSAGGLFAALDLNADPPARIESTLETEPAAVRRVVALDDPGLALIQRWRPVGPDRAEVVRVPSGETVRGVALPFRTDLPRTAHPNGTEIVTCGSETHVLNLRTMRLSAELPFEYDIHAHSHDGKRLIGVNRDGLRAHDAKTGRRLAEGRLHAKKGVPSADGITTLAVDPAGAWVYAGGASGRVYAFAADTLELRAAFEWHLGAVQGLAVSADGARLFSAGGDGCVKVWPIGDLMKGIE